MEAAIITTYRCVNKCVMCNIWRHPTKVEEEIKPDIIDKLPDLRFANVTGGEPMLRDDIDEIIGRLAGKARRIVLSTNGYYTEKIVSLARKHKKHNFGVRISLEGLPRANDELRGLRDCFDHGLRTLLELHRLGLKDIGFGITVSDRNARDMIELYQLAKALGVEFATAVVHNSYYFHKQDNRIENRELVIGCFQELIDELLRSRRAKDWFRAYFNRGLINYIEGRPRLLPCGAGEEMFFLDPFGEIRPCNGLEVASPENSMGNLQEQSFAEIWTSERAERIRQMVKNCPRNCWMIGTASPAIKKNLGLPARWILKNKVNSLLGKKYGQN